MFDIPVKRKPAPRLFCDICDVFDQHDTEDCPVQSSESSPLHTASKPTNNGDSDGKKKRVLPPPRKYCEVCEGKNIRMNSKLTFSIIITFFHLFSVFGHEKGECDAEETY